MDSFPPFLPSPATIFRLTGSSHGSGPQHRHVHPGQWTLVHTDGINMMIYPSGIVPVLRTIVLHVVICSPEFVLQWNRWVRNVYYGVLHTDKYGYYSDCTLCSVPLSYLGEVNAFPPISIPTPSLATCHPLETTLINSSRLSLSETVGPKGRSPDLAISHVVGI